MSAQSVKNSSLDTEKNVDSEVVEVSAAYSLLVFTQFL